MKVMLINQQPKTPCLGFRKVALKRQLPEADFFPNNLWVFFVAEMIHVKDFHVNDRGNVWSFRLSGALFVSFRFLLLKVNVDPFPHEKVKYHLRYFKDFFFVFFPDHFFQASYCKSWLGMI